MGGPEQRAALGLTLAFPFLATNHPRPIVADPRSRFSSELGARRTTETLLPTAQTGCVFSFRLLEMKILKPIISTRLICPVSLLNLEAVLCIDRYLHIYRYLGLGGLLSRRCNWRGATMPFLEGAIERNQGWESKVDRQSSRIDRQKAQKKKRERREEIGGDRFLRRKGERKR